MSVEDFRMQRVDIKGRWHLTTPLKCRRCIMVSCLASYKPHVTYMVVP